VERCATLKIWAAHGLSNSRQDRDDEAVASCRRGVDRSPSETVGDFRDAVPRPHYRIQHVEVAMSRRQVTCSLALTVCLLELDRASLQHDFHHRAVALCRRYQKGRSTGDGDPCWRWSGRC